jgi:uncharacterized membrane protein YjjP (DUF1212 family)
MGNDASQPGGHTDVALVINFVADAGKVMLESSPTVSEVESRLRRFLPAVGLGNCSLDANFSSFLLSYWGSGDHAPITTMREVQVSEPRLERLWGAESLLDQLESGAIGVHDAYDRLRQLQGAPRVRRRYAPLAVMVSVTGWVLFLNGVDAVTLLVAVLASLLAMPVDRYVTALRLPAFTSVFAATMILAAIPNLAAAAGVSLRVGPAVVGAMYLYLPGRALVSSVIDGLSGSPVSALARGVQALVTAGSVTMGMLVGSQIGAGLGLQYTPDVTEAPLIISVAGVVLGMFGSTLLWGMPWRFMAPTLAMGALGWIVVTLMTRERPGDGADWVSFALAAGVVGLCAAAAASAQNASASMYAGVAILPLVPGFTLYQAVLALTQGKNAAAVETFGEAAVLSLAIAVGVAFGLALGANLLAVRRKIPLGHARA